MKLIKRQQTSNLMNKYFCVFFQIHIANKFDFIFLWSVFFIVLKAENPKKFICDKHFTLKLKRWQTQKHTFFEISFHWILMIGRQVVLQISEFFPLHRCTENSLSTFYSLLFWMQKRFQFFIKKQYSYYVFVFNIEHSNQLQEKIPCFCSTEI